MQIITRKTKLIFKSNEDKQKLIDTLILYRSVFNFCSNLHFSPDFKFENNIVKLHAKCYKQAKSNFLNIKSMIVIAAENECLSAYRSAKSNKYKIDKPINKKKLSLIFNARMISYKDNEISLLTNDKRIKCTIQKYKLIEDSLRNYAFGDVTISVKNGDVYISFPFKIETNEVKSKLAIGIDLGVRRIAATSEGVLIIDKKFNKRKREIRYLKRQLRSKADKGSRTAKRHLKKLSQKERNTNKNFVHHVANKLLNTKADTLVLENLDVKKLKSKKKHENKNRISQISMAELLFCLTYKAHLRNKKVITVSPAYTSQDDSVTGKRDGIRKGCRYYSASGLIYDADVNAAVNIAKRSKLPISQKNLLDGQGFVNSPYGSYRPYGEPCAKPLSLDSGS